MIALRDSVRCITLGLIAGSLAACQPGQDPLIVDGNGGMNVTTPRVLVNARNVDHGNLFPDAFLNDGTRFTFTEVSEGAYTSEQLVQPNTTYRLTIEWIETLPQGEVILARLEDNVFVDDDGVLYTDAAIQYSTQIDTDGDSYTNLEERELGSDPLQILSVPFQDDPSQTPPEPTPPVVTPPVDEPPIDDEPVVVITEPPVVEPVDPEPEPEPEPAPSGDLDTPTVIIPRIPAASAPQIDGLGLAELASNGSLIGEWRSAVQFDVNGVPLHINNLMIDQGTSDVDGTPHRRWAAMHDGTYIYLLVLVTDNGLVYFDSENPWEDDTLELFIDGDNSKSTTWGDDDDFQFLIPMMTLDGDPNDNEDGRFLGGIQASTTDIDLTFVTGPDQGPDGAIDPRIEQDVYEIRFEIASAGIEIGEEFGFELQINDDDNGDARDGKWGWFHPSRGSENTDQTYLNPSIMGTVILAE